MSELFLSHAASDAALAEFLERELAAVLVGVPIFRTTRVGQIGSGREWLSVIQSHLLSADRFLILLTPGSVRRPWISFEAGAAWARGQLVVPVVAAGLSKSDVPEPLKLLQLQSLEVVAEAEQVFQDLGGTLYHPDKFVGHARQLGRIVRSKALADEEWLAVDHDGRLLAWGGPLEDLTEGQPRGVPPGAESTLRDAGLSLQFSTQAGVILAQEAGFVLVYEIERMKTKHLLLGNYSQVLMVKLEVADV